ncbi:MAG: hypothetical protein IJV48_01805 [Ruminococcus sp.]|nr:hypothetical protein [Ruminococcus sp.]
MKSKLTWAPFVPLALAACFFKLAQGLLPEGAVLGLSALVLDYLYMAAVGLIFIFALIFCLVDKKISAYYLPHRNIIAGLVGLLLALLLAADGAMTLLRVFGSGNVNVLSIISSVLALLSAILFIVLALNHITRNKDSRSLTLFNVMPALLCGVRMVLCFVSFTTISIRLADVSSLICYIFATLFFFNYAVALSLTKTKNAVKNCMMYGFPAVAALIPYGVYRLWFTFDSQDILNNAQPLEMLLFGLYILAVLIELSLFVKDKDSVVVIENEESLPDISDEKVEGFLASNVNEDENDMNEDTAYLETRDTEDFLYQETPIDDDPEVNEEVAKDFESFLTETAEEAPADDDRPKDYESRLDEIDKLIIEINGQSD